MDQLQSQSSLSDVVTCTTSSDATASSASQSSSDQSSQIVDSTRPLSTPAPDNVYCLLPMEVVQELQSMGMPVSYSGILAVSPDLSTGSLVSHDRLPSSGQTRVAGPNTPTVRQVYMKETLPGMVSINSIDQQQRAVYGNIRVAPMSDDALVPRLPRSLHSSYAGVANYEEEVIASNIPVSHLASEAASNSGPGLGGRKRLTISSHQFGTILRDPDNDVLNRSDQQWDASFQSPLESELEKQRNFTRQRMIRDRQYEIQVKRQLKTLEKLLPVGSKGDCRTRVSILHKAINYIEALQKSVNDACHRAGVIPPPPPPIGDEFVSPVSGHRDSLDVLRSLSNSLSAEDVRVLQTRLECDDELVNSLGETPAEVDKENISMRPSKVRRVLFDRFGAKSAATDSDFSQLGEEPGGPLVGIRPVDQNRPHHTSGSLV